jgi:hypothetical protein
MQNKSSWLFAYAGISAGIAGSLVICWLEWCFYKDVSALPPGSEIRPIGHGIYELAVGGLTFLLTIPLSMAGAYFSIKQRRLIPGLLSLLGIVLAIIPLPLAFWLGQKIIAVTGVTLES